MNNNPINKIDPLGLKGDYNFEIIEIKVKESESKTKTHHVDTKPNENPNAKSNTKPNTKTKVDNIKNAGGKFLSVAGAFMALFNAAHYGSQGKRMAMKVAAHIFADAIKDGTMTMAEATIAMSYLKSTIPNHAGAQIQKIRKAEKFAKQVVEDIKNDITDYNVPNPNKKTTSSRDSSDPSKKQKTFQTYTKSREHDGRKQVYSGRTSGTGTPEDSVANRDYRHHKTIREGYGAAKLDKTSKNRFAIRGREQQLIDYHGGAQSNKPIPGTSGNAINGISPTRIEARRFYIQQAIAEFGDLKR